MHTRWKSPIGEVRFNGQEQIFVLAALFPLAGAFATYAGFSPGESMRQMHPGEKR